ncbi:serine/threonine protein kinase [Streptomycetaceae bacterium NBC_01309]
MFRLGAGGMGRVYLARSGGGRFVALKTVHAWLAEAPGFRERFALEIEASRRVSGAGTVAVVAADAAAAVPWLASVYVPGPSLAEAVHGHGPLPGAAVWRLLSGLAEALGRVHGCRLVHRDLKPSNVLLSQDGPRLIDFGIVRAVDRTALTGTGLAVGSPGYMAPEQARGSGVGPAADVFALGAVLAYAATGREAFGGGSGPDVLYRVVHEEPEVGGLPDELAGVVGRCLAKKPEERPSLAELRALAAAHDTGGQDWLPGPVMSAIAARAVHLLSLEAPGPLPAAGPTPTGQGAADPATEPNVRRLPGEAQATGAGIASAARKSAVAAAAATHGPPAPSRDAYVTASVGARGMAARRRRMRAALGAVLSVVVVAGIAVSLKALRGDGSPSQPSAAGSSPMPTKPAVGVALPPSVPVNSPSSPSAPSSPAAPTAPTPPVSSAPATAKPAAGATPSPRVTGHPDRFVPAAWLPDGQAPFVYRKSPTVGWRFVVEGSDGAESKLNATTGVESTPAQTVTSCDGPSGAWEPTGVLKAQVRGYRSPDPGVPAYALQELYFFRDEVDAQRALETFAGFYLTCPHDGEVFDVETDDPLTEKATQVAAVEDGMAWLHTYRRPDGRPGEATGAYLSDTREYFVQRGNVLAYIAVTGGPEVSAADNDLAVLNEMAARVCVYSTC